MTQNSPSTENHRAGRPKRCYARRKGDAAAAGGLRDEIAILRMLVRRVSALVDDGGTLADQLRLLDVTSMSIARLAKIMKTERSLDEGTNMMTVINQVLAEVTSELGIENTQRTNKGRGA